MANARDDSATRERATMTFIRRYFVNIAVVDFLVIFGIMQLITLI